MKVALDKEKLFKFIPLHNVQCTCNAELYVSVRGNKLNPSTIFRPSSY